MIYFWSSNHIWWSYGSFSYSVGIFSRNPSRILYKDEGVQELRRKNLKKILINTFFPKNLTIIKKIFTFFFSRAVQIIFKNPSFSLFYCLSLNAVADIYKKNISYIFFFSKAVQIISKNPLFSLFHYLNLNTVAVIFSRNHATFVSKGVSFFEQFGNHWRCWRFLKKLLSALKN